MMKLSNETIGVLKNFASINPGVVLREGNTIRTISPQKTVMASATVAETFEKEAGIFDISRFLATLSLFDQPDIIFGADRFTVSGGRRKLNYTYTPENMIVTPPDKDITVPSPEATFSVDWKDIESVIRAAGVLQLPEVAFISDGTDVIFSAVDSKNPTADNYSVTVAEGANAPTFRIVIKTENLKLMPINYEIALSSKGMAHFKSDTIQYWVAVEAK